MGTRWENEPAEAYKVLECHPGKVCVEILDVQTDAEHSHLEFQIRPGPNRRSYKCGVEFVTEVAIEINKAEECDGSNLVWGCNGKG